MSLAQLFDCGKCGRNLGPFAHTARVYLHKKKGWCHTVCPKRRGAKKVVRVAIKGVDLPATMARKFNHLKSRVMLDGREILYGLDYQRRVREVLERDGYKCRWILGQTSMGGILPSARIICAAPANNHPHHLIKRSKKRNDHASNLISICTEHHRIAHPEHQSRFTTDAERNKRLNQELVNEEVVEER